MTWNQGDIKAEKAQESGAAGGQLWQTFVEKKKERGRKRGLWQ
jgi:hypothetical protein